MVFADGVRQCLLLLPSERASRPSKEQLGVPLREPYAYVAD